jgi:hypothetical protein
MAAFQFYLQSGNSKVWLVRNGSHIVFGKKFPGEKIGERQCVVVM